MPSSIKVLKISSFVLDFLCCVFAALSIAACSYALIVFPHSVAIRLPCIFGIVLGVLIFGSTIFGCIAALRENIRLSWIYTAILMALVFAQITVVFAEPIDFPLLANETVGNAWNNQLYNNGSMSYFEIKYHCCGMSGPMNYMESGITIPQSCYLNQNSSIVPDLFTVGCNKKLAIAYVKGTSYERACDWSVIGIELLTMILTGLFAINLQNAERRRLYR
ncbi:protein late bloomer [Drosophila sulfurigaster albostrigata]|uniref:protein late bloomer n=1 Tax=Drosophila sulfurigaster albostrigata TaxID=89887 RepID=UPI002D21DD84|nr:protein late bloomer [Drosophila sulfurigaster albostrigata]